MSNTTKNNKINYSKHDGVTDRQTDTKMLWNYKEKKLLQNYY